MNIFNIEGISLKEEFTEILEKNEDIKIERIVSEGHTTDWLSNKRKEFVVLLRGNSTIQFEGREVELNPGDTLLINENERHRVAYTSCEPKCIWLCVYF